MEELANEWLSISDTRSAWKVKSHQKIISDPRSAWKVRLRMASRSEKRRSNIQCRSSRTNADQAEQMQIKQIKCRSNSFN